MTELAETIDLGVSGGDELQRVVVLIPAYTNVSTRFLTNILGLVAIHPEPIDFLVMQSPYVDQSMRHAVADLLEQPDWKRIVVIENDMIAPRDALIKHALHTDDIVGSVYFQHAPPHEINCMFAEPGDTGRYGHPSAPSTKMMMEKPALWKCDAVGLGFTSIARRVCEDWDANIPMFQTGYKHEERADSFTHGTISHDVHFCVEARRQGFEIYLDTSIQCQHLTESWTDWRHYFNSHAEELKLGNDKLVHLPNRIVLPYQAQKEHHVPRLAKAH